MTLPNDTSRRPCSGRPLSATSRAVPIAVRRKLTESAQTLDAEGWSRLPAAARRRLERMPFETGTDKRTFATLVDWLRLTFVEPGCVNARRSVPPGTWSWQLDQPPEHLARALAEVGLEWETLDVDQRYGLVEASFDSEPEALRRCVDELAATLARGAVVA